MRALLYKDLVVNRSTILSYLVLAVVVLLLPYVGGHWVFPLAITLVFPVAYLQQEHKEKWLQLAAVLPYSPWAVVGARYVVTALAGAIAAGCTLLKQFAFHGLAEIIDIPVPICSFGLLYLIHDKGRCALKERRNPAIEQITVSVKIIALCHPIVIPINPLPGIGCIRAVVILPPPAVSIRLPLSRKCGGRNSRCY